MTPQEKATDLIKKFTVHTLRDFSDENFEETKQCALIAVDEIIEELDEIPFIEWLDNRYIFWVQVKSELDKL